MANPPYVAERERGQHFRRLGNIGRADREHCVEVLELSCPFSENQSTPSRGEEGRIDGLHTRS
jgi:hypothetical protein